MAYPTKRNTLELNYEMLRPLEAGDPVSWTPGYSPEASWPEKLRAAHNLAGRIRGYLSIAALYPEDYPLLADAARRFRIVVNRDLARVEAIPAAQSTPAGVLVERISTQGLESAELRDSSGSQTVDSIIQSMARRGPSNASARFANPKLSLGELTRLYEWAESATPKWLMFVSDDAVTLQRPTLDLQGLNWTPEDGV
jgi:hypothetical protein